MKAVEQAVGLSDGGKMSLTSALDPYSVRTIDVLISTGASRKAMSDAKLPLSYRDSCAGYLIPLNKCRVDEYYLPWKCVVRHQRQG